MGTRAESATIVAIASDPDNSVGFLTSIRQHEASTNASQRLHCETKLRNKGPVAQQRHEGSQKAAQIIQEDSKSAL